MTSVKTRLRKSTVPGGAGRLVFRLICDRKVQTISLPYLLREEEWNEAAEAIVFSGNETLARIVELQDIKTRLEEDKKELLAICRTFDGKKDVCILGEIVTLYKKRKQLKCFCCLLEEYMQRMQQEGNYSAYRHYRSTLHSFKRFKGTLSVTLEEITPGLVWEYIRYLQQRGLKNTTIMFYVHILHRIWNKATAEKIITGLDSPFRGIRLTLEKSRKLAVSEKTIKEIERLELNREEESVRLARDLFLFSFYTRGMPFIDIVSLKKTDIESGFLGYRRHKTGQRLYIKLLPEIKRLIERYQHTSGVYLFPILKNPVFDRREYESALRLQNLRLKKVWKLLKNASLPLSTYVSRHSWASIAKQKGIPEEIISNGMGHTSLKTTRIYIACSHNKYIDLANEIVVTNKKCQRSLFDWNRRI